MRLAVFAAVAAVLFILSTYVWYAGGGEVGGEVGMDESDGTGSTLAPPTPSANNNDNNKPLTSLRHLEEVLPKA